MASKIIKGTSSSKSPTHSGLSAASESGVIHKRVMDAGKQADEILDVVQKEAQIIKDEAQAILNDTKHKRDEAVKRGYAEGESKGLAKVTEKLVAFEKRKEEFFENAEPEIVKLVLTIAEKVIGKIAHENSQVIKSVVREALDHTIGDRIVVKLNPEDYKSIMEGEREFKDVVDRTKRLSFREDDSIAMGGCVVETDVGTIDAQLGTQLEAIKKALLS